MDIKETAGGIGQKSGDVRRNMSDVQYYMLLINFPWIGLVE